jgi:glycosyltransferase involved in cell wall biosynthesis
MKFLFITTFDFGGAAEATLRLHRALIEYGHESVVLVKYKTKKDSSVISMEGSKLNSFLKKVKKKIQNSLFKDRTKEVTLKEYSFFNLNEKVNYFSFKKKLKNFPFIPEVIIATWTSDFLNFASLENLQECTRGKLFYWSLDMSSFTGGCHYSWSCEGYTKDCSNCPAIIVEKYKNYPQRNLHLKKESTKRNVINFIAGSEALLQQARKSALFGTQGTILKVLMCIDEKVFNKRDKSKSRRLLNIEEQKKVIFYGSTYSYEKRKGMVYFIEAMNILYNQLPCINYKNEDIVVILAGHGVDNSDLHNKIPFQVKSIGFINGDEQLSQVYNAADVFVNSSIEDSGPMMINESMMCGTPVVSFNVGVTDDLIVNGFSGYKAPIYDSRSMAEF